MTLSRSLIRNDNTTTSSEAKQNARIAGLEAENVALRARLANTLPGGDNDQHVQSEERYQSLATKYNDLFKQYGDLETRHKRCDLHIEVVEKKYRHAKDVVRQWAQYIESKKLAKQISTTRHNKPTTPRSLSDIVNDELPANSDSDITPRAALLEQGQRDDQSIHAGLIALDRSTEQALPDVYDHPDGKRDPTKSVPATGTLRVTSSQTTDVGSDPIDVPSSPPGKREPSSDSEPVVVSTRSLKRKRNASPVAMPQPVRIKQEAGSPDKPIEVKSEDYSSPVLKHRSLVRQDTLDLDANTEHLLTPKKHWRDRGTLSEEVQMRPLLTARKSSLSSSEMLDDGLDVPLKEERLSDLSTTSLHATGTDPALQPISINRPADHPHLRSVQRARKGRQDDQDAASKAALISEDGESQNVVAPVKGMQTPFSRPTDSEKAQRLDTLLQGQQLHRHPLAGHKTPKPAAPRPKGPLTPVSPPAVKTAQISRLFDKPQMTPPTRRLDIAPASLTTTKRPPAKTLAKSTRKPDGLEKSPPPVRPEDEPLRLRPFASLRLEDFRINPQYMGEKYAYSETVRGAARKCLPGCTRPDCCGGAFMKAVQMNAPMKNDKSDAEVLEAYFGANWQAIIGAYPADRRTSLLQEARASAFANQYGKHRNAFERQSTPPGFWRTDMPSTQEAAEYRAQAEAEKRVQVETRWREAMRGNGRWKFRDE